MTDKRNIFDFFAVVGLKNEVEYLMPSALECGCRNSVPLAPITDICVIFPGLGEKVPEGFEVIESTPLGYPADLNHGSLRTNSVFVCYRRGYHKPPLVDIGVLDEGRGERQMLDSNTVLTTPFGRPANVNNASQGIYLTYRRAQPNSAPSQLVVTHICVILPNKGESPPHTYYKIPKNLNKGMVGSEVYLCYKKSQGTSKRLAFKPAILDSFPNEESFPLSQNIPMFCLPMGALIECWPARCQPPDRSFSTFVLTDQDGSKYYGSSVTFYEPYKGTLRDEQLDKLEMSNTMVSSGAVEDSSNTNDPAEKMSYYCNLSICIISRHPFFNAFKRFLFYLHRLSLSPAEMVPLERYISHLMHEVSFPSARCPRVMVQLGNETISFEVHDDRQLPLSGAALFETLKCLGPDNLMYVVLLALLEKKILVHSLRPWLLTAVAESVCALMFPFHWQCPYIPQCPLPLAGVLHAPLPFIAGVDSRYFDLYEDPPSDVTCFDLDTSTVSISSVRHNLKLGILPKKISRQLKSSLEKLHRRLYQEEFDVIALRKSVDYMPLEVDYKIQRRKLTLEAKIQDAFLKFMTSLMNGYTAFLRPIKSAPRHIGATDIGSLFDVDSFLRSRDKSSYEFFKRFSETQCFNRFIEERSFVSDKNTYNAFFDDCIAKMNVHDERSEFSLLDMKFFTNNQTEFTPPPEFNSDNKEHSFKYDGFPRKLNPDLFQLDKLSRKRTMDLVSDLNIDGIGSALLRTKQEIRSSLETVTYNASHCPYTWPKTLLFYAYSIWFMLLPSLISMASSKRKILHLAIHTLYRLEECGITPLDQVCYRIVIQLCGDYEQPLLAVRVLQAMQRSGLEQNAVTYGIYHQAVLKTGWPTGSRLVAIKTWNRIALMIRAVVLFKQGITNYAYYSRCPSVKNSLANANTINAATPVSNKTFVATQEKQLDAGESQNTSLIDPLGATFMTADQEKQKNEQKSLEIMSPSRALFIKEHSASPFANYSYNAETTSTKSADKPLSWIRGLTSSPIVSRLMRSNTTGNFELYDGNDSSMLLPPTFSSIVTQMRKGYGDMMQSTSFSSRLREGVNSFVNEVRNLNISYSKDGTESSSSSHHGDCEDGFQDPSEAVFLLRNGIPQSRLISSWWINNQFNALSNSSAVTDVTISSSSVCPHCKTVVYDEDLMAGWAIDDSNLNTNCVFCNFAFVPSLTIRIRDVSSPHDNSWYECAQFLSSDEDPKESNENSGSLADGSKLSVPFISPLVLRRELESLLSENFFYPTNNSLRCSHPIIFWNMLYYTQRLGLPTHLPSWFGTRVHVRCIYDVPEIHTDSVPLYLINPDRPNEEAIGKRSLTTYWQVVESLKHATVTQALYSLLIEHRQVNDRVKIQPHFPLFRDIHFVAADRFGKDVIRDQLDQRYRYDFEHLPPRILSLLPAHDKPPKNISIACRRILLPLDLS